MRVWPLPFSLLLVIAYGVSTVRLIMPCLPATQGPLQRITTGLLLTLAALGTLAGIAYRIDTLRPPIIFGISAIVPLFFWLLSWNYAPDEPTITVPSIARDRRVMTRQMLLLVLYFATLAIAVSLLWVVRTGEALRTPWGVVPTPFFGLIFAAALAATGLLGTLRNTGRFAILALLTGLCFSVATIVYRIGYGFDPFIHQATEQVIADAGSIFPKTWYYLGQYGLVVTLHTLSRIPIPIIDHLLLPVLATLAVPLAALTFAERLSPAHARVSGLTALALTSVPTTWFIVTAPQGLANLALLALIAAIALVPHPWTRGRWLLALGLVLAALITHPLAGCIALVLVVL